MSLPGLSLPGLGISNQKISQPGASTTSSSLAQSTRTETLSSRTEWRFEVGFSQNYTIRVISGNAEIFGVELAPNHLYAFSGCKAAIFTWQGCQLEISGEAESEYAGLETEYAVEWLNVHGMLESVRDVAPANPDGGPRVLVVGPDFGGKSSLVRSLAAWAVKCGRAPTVVNVDSREGFLAPPGTMSAATVGSQLDVENGYGISPISGPTITPIKTPIVYHCPYSSPTERPDVYKALITRTALSVLNRLEEDPAAKASGVIIDTPGQFNDPKSNYDMISHLVSEFSVTLILTIGSERLYNDLQRRFGSQAQAGGGIPALRISKPGGAVERDSSFMKQMQNQQIRSYYFGTTREPLNPHSHTYSFVELHIYRANSPSLTQAGSSFGRAAEEDEGDIPYARPKSSSADFEKMTPSNEMLGRLVAVKYCDGESDDLTIRDSAVMGLVYVSEVDETKKRVRFLAPHPQRWGNKALIWGAWPDAVMDLVG